MRLICRSAFSFALVSTLLVACGGDDDGGGGGGVTPDAKVFMDAPADTAAACVVPASVPGGTAGSDAMRQSMNWIATRMVNGQPVTLFSVSFPADMTNKNFVTFTVIKDGANWVTNTAIPFVTSPTAQGTAIARIDENLNTQTGTADRTLWASSGSITFTEIAQTKDAKITFSTTAANFREIDANGADVPGGCTSMVGGIQAFLQQATAVPFVPPQQDGTPAWTPVVFERALN